MHAALGLLLACGGWLPPRAVAGSRGRHLGALALDALVPMTLFLLLTALTARPLFSGTITFIFGAGFAYADRAKRRVLAEPVVFTDVFQAVDILRHPRLALPFPHQGRVLLCVAAAVSVFALAFRAEPAPWTWSPWPVLLLGLLLLVLSRAVAGPLNQVAGRALQRLSPSGDPLRDGEALGPFATLLAYAIIAGAERGARQAEAAVPKPAPTRPHALTAEPLVVVQCESFFDARRLHPDLAGLSLPELDGCRRGALQWGRMAVPSWGANTVRTEFSVLSGLPPAALGFDRFNPYHRFARQPVNSLAWRMRSAGYRTICLHPFDRRFYGRDRVLPMLGFDDFIGEEAFSSAARNNGYVADIEAARVAAEIVRQERGRVFLFVITMENHGPWPAPSSGLAPLLPPALSLPEGERQALECYLQSLGNADRMLGTLAAALDAGGVLAFYGDHLPSFPASFAHLGLHDLRSDYLLWRGGAGLRSATGRRQDLDAHALCEAILQARGPLEETPLPEARLARGAG